MIPEFNNLILKQADKLIWRPATEAPSTEADLFGSQTGSELIIWTGESDYTIWGDKRVNWAFRALHDALHLKTGLGFTPEQEIELGRIQASQYDGLLADLVYLEVAGQAEYFREHGHFIKNQVEWTINKLKSMGG